MSIAKSFSSSLTGILGTVATTATSATKAINIGATALDSLETYVSDHKATTVARSRFYRKNIIKIAKDDSRMETATRRTELATKLNADPLLKKEWDKLQTEYDAIEKDVEAELAAL